MLFRTNQLSRFERLASFAAAVGATVGLVLLAVSTPGRFVLAGGSAVPRDARQMSEHSTYLASAPAPTVPDPATRQATRRFVAATSRSVTAQPSTLLPADTAAVSPTTSRTVEPLVSETAAGVPDEPVAINRKPNATSRAKAGAPAASAMVGFRLPGSGPTRLDSVLRAVGVSLGTALATGRLAPPPLTQAEIDSAWRERAFDAAVARGAGAAPRPSAVAAGGVAIPLPFGGPSRKQRERDRTLFAELKVTVAQRQQRADSVAGERRRHADSLARLPDSLRRDSRRR